MSKGVLELVPPPVKRNPDQEEMKRQTPSHGLNSWLHTQLEGGGRPFVNRRRLVFVKMALVLNHRSFVKVALV